MIVRITPELALAEEVNDCTRLHVEAPDLDDEAVADALAVHGIGRAGDPGHLWLDIEWLRGAARATATLPHWDASFDTMLEHARARGWLDAAGRSLAAHIERRAT